MRSEERARVERIRDHMIEDLIAANQVMEQRVSLLERCLMAHHEVSLTPGALIGDACPVCAHLQSALDKPPTLGR